jgi:DNA-binding NarL/FixJ family response regulator
MILYAAADLLWASKIKATADALGIPARPVRTSEMLDARLADTHPTALLIDLDKDDALALLRHARAAAPTLRILAFGPHVSKALLQSARDAGATDVLTRGALEHNLEDTLLSLSLL